MRNSSIKLDDEDLVLNPAVLLLPKIVKRISSPVLRFFKSDQPKGNMYDKNR